jgi:hypothetical protein
VADPQGTADLSLGPIVNARAFEVFVKEPLSDTSATVEDMTISGETRIIASIQGTPSDFSLRGFIQLSGGDLEIPASDIKTEGLEIKLPFFFRRPETADGAVEPIPVEPQGGHIRADRVQWKSQEWPDLVIPLNLRENTLSVVEELELPLWGGTITIREGRIHDPFGEAREIALGLKIDGLDLSQMTGEFMPWALPGIIRGDFPEMKISRTSLATRGSLTVSALGGRIDVANLRGVNPLSRFGDISMDVGLHDLHLEEISQLFEFGRMGGVIEGQVKGLTFSSGQPEAFELEIRSVKKKGVKQFVDMEAVNDLSVVSSGQSVPRAGTASQFLKYFPYSRIGIYCKLENDVFTLRGTIHEKGVEYLIKKAVLRGISVINRNPENQIRWKQMLARLKQASAGMASGEGPVVN